MTKNTYCVIMAGGIGSRFWPISRTAHPKQFLDILGVGKTLIQQTFERYNSLCPKENILVVTNEIYKNLVLEQLPEIKEEQVLCEPSRRNTAPCLAYAAYKINSINPNAKMIVAPSDHLVLKEKKFAETINIALQAAEDSGCLITLGIKPSRPDTGYGYIQFDEKSKTYHRKVKKVKTFTEKPSFQMAKKFIESGDFCWNSGMFIWTVKSILNAFDRHLPEVGDLFKEGAKHYNTSREMKFIHDTYQVCKNISIDYGIMEKADNVYVVLSDFGWSDLGTWGSLYEHIKRDTRGNAIIGNRAKLYDSKTCIINAPKDKLVVLQGLDDYIVVDTEDALLVCKKEDEQKIKQFVNDIKIGKDGKYL
ncbi:MAG: mannose-1-phosphate guanylyltransferase [Flavobacteriales bacterium]|nr:MAG: mannose-1-phosphate guanylyltransferase [Flavobacteriales bacterium]